MIKIEKILNDNFGGLEDAMGGDKDLAHFYKSLIGVCMQEYALDVLTDVRGSVSDYENVDFYYFKVQKEEWS